MKNEMTASLEQLGLTGKEAVIYTALLAMKKGGALAVSTKAGTKRPTTYFVLEALRKKGLIASTTFRGVKDYRALPLEHLKHFVRKQRKAVDDQISSIQKLYNERQFKVRLRIYHGLSDVKTLLEKSLRERSALYILGTEEVFNKYLGDYWQFYIKRAQQLGVSPKFKQCNEPVSLLLWSDKVAFVAFGDTPQVSGFKNKELHVLYQRLWTNY